MRFNTLLMQIGLYIMSLWALYIFIIILKIDYSSFNSFEEFFSVNIISLICVILIIISIIIYYIFDFELSGTHDNVKTIEKCEDVSFEVLSFLSTIIIPLLFIEVDDARGIILLFSILFIIGIISMKTDYIYYNPTLALFGYRLYNVQINQNGELKTFLLLSNNKLENNSNICLYKINPNVYFGRSLDE